MFAGNRYHAPRGVCISDCEWRAEFWGKTREKIVNFFYRILYIL